VAPSDAQLRAVGEACDVSSRPLFVAAPLRVAASRELRQAPAPGAATRHMELDLGGSGLQYGTADTLYVCPENDGGLVAAVAARLGVDAGAWFSLAPRAAPAAGAAAAPPPPPLFPTPCTVRAALTHFLDIAGPPRRDLLRALARFASAPAEREELAASAAAWHKGARGGGGFLEVLRAFPSLAPPWEAVAQLLPRLSPRAYTIASSPLLHPQRLAICVSVLEAPRASGGAVKGVCSNFLARLRVGDAARVMVRPSIFKLPADRALPVVLVGPGTGVAPMRAFLQERRAVRERGATLGSAVLFFGCRGRDEDFIYREEFEGALGDGLLDALHTAFSRERAEKVYVQHLVEREGAAMWALLQRGAHVFVCGGKAMGADVKRAFERVRRWGQKQSRCAHPHPACQSHTHYLTPPHPPHTHTYVLAQVAEAHGGQTSGAAFVKSLSAEGRYVQELWS
jgi:NADPH-ferrihemoprotein reductase